MSGENINLLVPIIMAGGAGTRLWPLSREKMPKQFIDLLGDGRSTFQATLIRVGEPDFAPPIVITGEDFRFIVAEQMMAVGMKGQIVLEPARRDSAPAVAVGALLAQTQGANAVCVVLASDHLISNSAAFTRDCVQAAEFARVGRIMTLGITPIRPSTAYGYIARGEDLGGAGAFSVQRFVEKPNRENAARYIEQGMMWNSGNFLFTPEVMLGELSKSAPQIVGAAKLSIEKAQTDLDFTRLDKSAFLQCPTISIDHAVMEKTKLAGVVQASFGWSDIGSWDALHDVMSADQDGNVVEGDVRAIGTTNSLLRSSGQLTAVIGLDEVIVVSTADAVLVAAKSDAPKVKDLVAQLISSSRPEATDHLRVHRPWGWYQRIDIGPRFQVKQICVNPGGMLSLQRHFHRAEHWVVVHGTAEVTIDSEVRIVHENEAAYLPIGSVHRMRNPGKIPLQIIEVQVGSYTGEDDIVRIEDIYARV